MIGEGSVKGEGSWATLLVAEDRTLSWLPRFDSPLISLAIGLSDLSIEVGWLPLSVPWTIDAVVATCDCRRPQKENNPPDFLSFAVSEAVAAGAFSTILQPTGTSSSTTSFRSLTEISHAVEPLAAR